MKEKIKWTQVVLVVLMTAVLTGILLFELHLFITKAVPKMDAWREDRKKTWAWILENLAYFLPACTLCIANSLIYRKTFSARTHHIKAWITAGSTVCSYVGAILMINHQKKTVWAEIVEKLEPGKITEQLPALTYSITWLLRAAVPLVLVFAYQMIRAQSPDVCHPFRMEDSDSPIDESKYDEFADEV
ncbi:unknown [Clostridium sp. CAG:448]|nr:unknown [Clostridium sp. CAG:448]